MSNPNYPDGVNSLPYDKKETFERRLISVEIDEVPGDMGQGLTTNTRLEASVLITEDGEADIETTTLVFFGNGGEVLGDQVYEPNDRDEEIIKLAWDKYYKGPVPYMGSFLKDALKPR